MSYLLEEELISQGIFTKTTLRIRFNNKVYVRVKTLPMQFYEKAKKIKEEYTANNLDSLLIEHKNWIAIWVEELNKLEEIENNYFYRVQELSSIFEDNKLQLTDVPRISYLKAEENSTLQEVDYRDEVLHSTDDISPSRPLTRKYRGVRYDYKIPENNCKVFTQSKKIPKKYRGLSY